MKIYTSCYKTMLKRHKAKNDVYVKISRSLKYSHKNIDGILLTKLIDADWGLEFGPKTDLKHYKKSISKKQIKDFYSWLNENPGKTYFLLCFEDLNDKYTKTDELKYPYDSFVKAGNNKLCHRTILAEMLNEYYKLNIKEYQFK